LASGCVRSQAHSPQEGGEPSLAKAY